MHLSHEFTQRIAGTFGQDGERWLRHLPSTLGELTRRWSLTLLPAFENLSYNYVAPAIRADGKEVVLKVGVPNKELSTEIESLRLMDGSGAVQLFESDLDRGAMLLERLSPGLTLYELENDEAATTIATYVMEELWISAPEDHAFPTVSDWAKGFKRLRGSFDGGTGPFPEDLVEKAERIFLELLASMSEPVLLHGDLHHWNILSAEREPWLAIDPKGVIGEPEYEVGAWLRNPFPHILKFENPKQVMARRVEQFSESLGFDRDRLKAWGFAQAVLSGWWGYEDHGDDWDSCIELSRIMAELL